MTQVAEPASARDAVPDEVITTRLSSCRAWRNCVSALSTPGLKLSTVWDKAELRCYAVHRELISSVDPSLENTRQVLALTLFGLAAVPCPP